MASEACYLCAFFDALQTMGYDFQRDVYEGFGAEVGGVMRTLLIAYLMFMAFRATFLGGAGNLTKIPSIGILAVIASTIAQNFELFDTWILRSFEDTAISAGVAILQTVADRTGLNVPEGYSGYSILIATVESQVTQTMKWLVEVVLGALSFSFTSLVGSAITNLISFLAGFLIFLGLAFVVLLFTGYMAESMATFLIFGSMTPLLMAVFPFPWGRPFTVAAARVLLSAAMTVIFAAMAMGLTMAVNGQFRTSLQARKKGAAALETHCASLDPQTAAIDPNCIGLANGDILGTAEIQLTGPDFILLAAMVLVSIILHLKAKTWAANLSGANDGAGPVAGAIAGAKLAAAYTTGGASTFFLGGNRPGRVGDSLSGLVNAAGGGGAASAVAGGFARGGVVGGASSIIEQVRSGGRSAAPADDGFSGGGGPMRQASAPSTVELGQQSIDKLSQGVAKQMGGGNAGHQGRNQQRNRYGDS